ncbi:MAG: ATP-binding protein [Halorhabdus sp.]
MTAPVLALWSLSGGQLRVVYIGVFALAAAASFVSALRARGIADADTRRGLIALLVASGGWALAHAGYLAIADEQLGVALYQLGLVIGLFTVGPWLYFCSAYTGRSLHRDPTIRRVALGAYLAIVTLKLTNPIHGLYYTSQFTADPFPHVAVQSSLLHWTVMGASYALATVGYFMLFERFRQVSHDTTPLLVLLGLTGLPIAFDVMGMTIPELMEITYEPIGVAAFAVGLMFVYDGRFRTIRLAGERDDPVIVLDDDDEIQDFNRAAANLVPELSDRSVIGESFESVAPWLAGRVKTDDPIVGIETDAGTRYYRVTEQPFSATQTSLGRALVFTDETHREQYRHELERQNERLEDFASMLSHDLRNPLNVAQGRLELLRDECESEHIEAACRALSRIEQLVDDVLQMARQGQPVEETANVSVGAVARDAWEMVETDQAELRTDDAEITADPDRLQRLLENLFRNAVEHAGTDVTVTVGPLGSGQGFFVEDDGPGIPPEERDQIFDSGYTTAEDGTGFGLAIVEQIAEAHGWSVNLAEDGDGARFEIQTQTGV